MIYFFGLGVLSTSPGGVFGVLTSPGGVFGVFTRPGGVLTRPGRVLAGGVGDTGESIVGTAVTVAVG